MAQKAVHACRVATRLSPRAVIPRVAALGSPKFALKPRLYSTSGGDSYPESPNAFPWMVSESPARLVAADVPDDPNPIRRFIMVPIARYLSRNFADSVVKEVLGPGYLDTTMIVGAETAVQQFVTALSEDERAKLAGICTRQLYNRLETELDRLKARDEEVIIKVPRVYDIFVRNLLVVFGPSINYSNVKLTRRMRTWSFYEAGPTYFFLRWISLAFVVSRQEFLSSTSPTWQMLVQSTDKGGVVTVDCEIDADVEFVHKKRDGTVLFEEKQRRTLLLQFTSRHMQLAPSKREVLDGTAESPNVGTPSWRVSDIDNLLQSSAVS